MPATAGSINRGLKYRQKVRPYFKKKKKKKKKRDEEGRPL
jgi:hypothetical protein